jgi:hypothetical protein
LSSDYPRTYRTVEIKTSLKSEQREEAEKRTRYEYAIQVISPVPVDPTTGAQLDPDTLNDVAGTLPDSAVTRRSDRRANRQARRMSKALTHQTAPDNELTEIEGEAPLLSATTKNSTPSYWKSLRRVIRQARRDGYASECIEGSFLYTAFYQAEGITEESLKDIRLIEDIQESGILIKDGSYPNALVINAVPPQEQTVAHSFLPYYLYSIPRRAIYDLIHGRLVIVILVNQGRVFQALAEAGFSVKLSPRRTDRSFVVSDSIAAPSGAQYRIDIPNLAQYINEMVYEFHGRDYLVGITRSISQASAKAAIPKLEKKRGG